MFKLKKVIRARKILKLITGFLFKLFQISLRHKETRPDYGLEIFEYFYLPWRTDEEFKKYFNKISNYSLNPESRLYSVYELSKKYLQPDTTFLEVGCWNGGTSALIYLANKDKDADFILCDTFSGVTLTSSHDTYFKGSEYSDASVENIKKLEKSIDYEFTIIEGEFPNSMENKLISKPISFAHIDVDSYLSAKQSLRFIVENSLKGAVIVLDDYGGWFTDGVTKYGNEIKLSDDFFVVPNHLGQLIIYKVY